MDSIRKHKHLNPVTGREVIYSVGSKIFNGKATINKIEYETDNKGREITYVFVSNDRYEFCLWKKIVITWNNVIELEYDWNEILGHD
mgnify:CR=1 FL=1